MRNQIARRQNKEVLIITKEEEPCFNLGTGEFMPVSRDIDPIQREVIIREMKAQNTADSILSICVFGFAGMVTILCFILLFAGIEFVRTIGG